MTVLVCKECGETVTARSKFEAEGECPECGAEEGALVEQDAYAEDGVRHVVCENCGFTADAAVVDEQTGTVTTIDDPCPICHEALCPADQARAPRDMPEYKVARAAAAKLRRRHNDIPVDVDAIAAAAGLTVTRGPFAHDGMLVGAVIEVPDTAHTVVQRFVIAHETGHFELRHIGDRRKIEPEANAFASELLIPPAALKDGVGQGLAVPALARRFAVSRHAIVYALMSSKLIGSVRRS